ncbi:MULTISPECIES: DUF3616 domain-containing protein [unclassified Janthinobacterium]|uniref:DUF3616 domain-containing protein n=1 Tax=unclassified Janthinobacterium TaxID=2610881 RepID=UPI0003487F80|nr:MULTISPECIES: DUF3616 domain-containing protein [unclassified Janthinobacterium]MEC5159738.1 hypothetical protein [Janthinobacterium sp. CG_S6]
MSHRLRRAACALAASALLAAAPRAAAQQEFVYRGLCDASAAVALGPDRFIVADDERNTLKIYRRGVADAVDAIEAWKFLDTKKDKESDLEGAAAIGRRIYWISSHGRNKRGEAQARRHRFFATDDGDGQARPRLTGRVYAGLQEDMLAAAELRPLGLAAAAALGPEQPGGFNIEGLAATPQGQLLIGLRSPLLAGKALLLPLLNPDELIEGKQARFGAAFELDLGGRGVRSVERVGSSYLIVAGPTANAGAFALYRWSGRRGDAAVALPRADLGTLRPEAIFAVPGSDTVQVLSDDGNDACQALPEARQTFRSIIIGP